ncbi:hypothetical protein P607_12930 [Comamonas thiooxydans]|nr:hypothetical protein P607_12930 [Comamonas thiooxydans]
MRSMTGICLWLKDAGLTQSILGDRNLPEWLGDKTVQCLKEDPEGVQNFV